MEKDLVDKALSNINKYFRTNDYYRRDGRLAEKDREAIKDTLTEIAEKSFGQDLLAFLSDARQSRRQLLRLGQFVKAENFPHFFRGERCLDVLRSLLNISTGYYSLYEDPPLRITDKIWAHLQLVDILKGYYEPADLYDVIQYIHENEMYLDQFIAIIQQPDLREALSLTGRSMGVLYLTTGYHAWLNLARKIASDSFLKELINRYQKSSKDWPTRLSLMEEYFQYRKLGQVETRLVDKTLIDRLSPANQALITSASFPKRMKLLASIRRQTGIEKVRQIEQDLLNEQSVKPIDTKRKIAKLGLLESPNHPLQHLKVTLGYEIEFICQDPQTFEDLIFLETIGFHLGTGGDSSGHWESSPGPFLSAKTANFIFMRFLQAGLIDIYTYARQGIHTGVGLLGTEVSDNEYILASIWKAVSYASEVKLPHYNLSAYSSSLQYFKLNHRTSDFGAYTENKGQTLQTVTGFTAYQLLLENINAALKAYLLRQAGKDLTSDQKALAIIFEDFLQEWEEGCRYMKLPDLTQSRPKSISMVKLGQRVETALPTPTGQWTRWVRHQSSWNIVDQPLVIRGCEYPNIVAFSRSICWRYASRVRKAMDKAMREFIEELKSAKEAKGDQRRCLIDTLFLHFPCGLKEDATSNQKYKLFKKLVAEYLD